MQGLGVMVAVRRPQGEHDKEVFLFEKEDQGQKDVFSCLLKEIDVLP